MFPLEPSESGRLLRLSSTAIPDLTDKIIRPDDWQYCEAGGFGDVFRCRYSSGDGVKEVAVKAFRFSFSVDENKYDGGKTARMIHRELGIWRRLNHRNIVPFLGVAYGFGRQGSAALVSLWMPNGTLHTFLEAHDDQLLVAHRLQLLLDVANGLHYLHSFPMVHGDLSSNNVLLDRNFNACLTDFGCASLVGELPEGFAYLKMSTVRPGTLRWAAPEHFSLSEEETNRTIKSDIYSFGNMALLVLSGKYPWSEVRADTAVMLCLYQGLKPSRPLVRPIDDQHWALIEQCWLSISERPFAGDVMSSLQKLLVACGPQPPLCDLLGIQMPPLSGANAHGHIEAISHGSSNAEHPSSEDMTQNHVHRSDDLVSTPRKHVIDPHSSGSPATFRWARGNLLGKGTYGLVYLGINMSTGEMLAVKQVNKSHKKTQYPDFVSELKMEQEILGGLDHPHIIAYLGVEETDILMSIFLEYIPGGSIASCLREHSMFNEEVIKSFTAQILDGLVYLHANHIIHRNIEANNVLVDLSGICKLSGFGNALRVNDNHTPWMPMRGTVFWTAPEVTRGQCKKRYGPKVDVWSAGCVLLKMWNGGRTWQDGDVFALVVEQATRRGMSLPLPSDVALSYLAIDFSHRCFVVDPEARASAAELLRHPYLTLEPDWVFTGFK